MNWTAYMDESEGKDAYVIAGYVAPEEIWSKFSREWSSILPLGVRDKNGQYTFKMRDMCATSRIERVSAFYRIIEDYELVGLSCAIRKSSFLNLRARISTLPRIEIDWSEFENPYFLSFRCLLDMFHVHKERFGAAIPVETKVDFIFDERTEQKLIGREWEAYLNNRTPEVRARFGAQPKFLSDTQNPPLQAADLWAWWVRKWIDEGQPEKIAARDFSFKRRNKKLYSIHIEFDEDQLAINFKSTLQGIINDPSVAIVDYSYSIS